MKMKQRLDFYCSLTRSQCSDGNVGPGVSHLKAFGHKQLKGIWRLHWLSQLYFVTENKLRTDILYLYIDVYMEINYPMSAKAAWTSLWEFWIYKPRTLWSIIGRRIKDILQKPAGEGS